MVTVSANVDILNGEESCNAKDDDTLSKMSDMVTRCMVVTVSANVDILNGEESCNAKDDDTLSEMSDMGSQIAGEVYTLQEINDFLDTTFCKTVDVRDFFPDTEKLVSSVLLFQRTVSYDNLDKKNIFRLKKMVTNYGKIHLFLIHGVFCSSLSFCLFPLYASFFIWML